MIFIVKDDTIIIAPKFNKLLDLELINKYKNLIFSNYALNDDLFYNYKNDNICNLQFIKSEFNQKINNLPNSLTHLTFGNNFNQEVNNLPNSITHLTFGRSFNQDVNNLPNSITHLIFGWNFNQEVNNLSNSITHLTFGYHFNQEVNNLPNSITHLIFGVCFNQEVNNLPNSLTHLIFGSNFNQKVDLSFNIKYLKLNCNNLYLIDYLPNSIEELELDYHFDLELNNLPSSIKKISFHINSKYNKELNCLPNFIELLQLPQYYDKKIFKIPQELKKLICYKKYIYINDYNNINIESYK